MINTLSLYSLYNFTYNNCNFYVNKVSVFSQAVSKQQTEESMHLSSITHKEPNKPNLEIPDIMHYRPLEDIIMCSGGMMHGDV